MKLFFTPPNWLRWILFLPASVLLGLLAIGILEPLAKLLKGEYDSPNSFWIALFAAGALAQYLFSWTAQQVAPKGKVVVHRATSIVSLAILALLLVDAYQNTRRVHYEDIAQLYGASFGAVYAWITIPVTR